jgi:hypothetical protein
MAAISNSRRVQSAEEVPAQRIVYGEQAEAFLLVLPPRRPAMMGIIELFAVASKRNM